MQPFTPVHPDDLLPVIHEAAAFFTDKKDAASIRQKGRSDYVTQVDIKVQDFLSEKLHSLYPQIQFMGEEKDNLSLDFSQDVWILDPVDGTTNLIHDMHASVISLALARNREIILGMICDPYMREDFTAEKGRGAFLNGQPIHVSPADSLEESLIAIGTSPYHRDLSDWTFTAARKIYDRCQDIRRSGSAALDLAYIACGRLDGSFEGILQPWDFAAGSLIVKEAGGRVTGLSGEKTDCFRAGGILAGNGLIHEQLITAMDGGPLKSSSLK